MIPKWMRRAFPNKINVVFFILAFAAVIPVLHTLLTWREIVWGKTTCPANLKQIGAAMMMYAGDHDEVLPPRQNKTGRERGVVSWRSIIASYVSPNVPAFCCPQNPVVADPENDSGNDLEFDGFSRSYAVNSTTGAQHGLGPFSDKFSKGLPINRISNTSNLVIVAETTAAYNDFNVLQPKAFTQQTGQRHTAGSLFAGHGGRSNYLYFDSHIALHRPMEMMDAESKINPWTIDGAPFTSADAAKARTTLEFAQKQYGKGTP